MKMITKESHIAVVVGGPSTEADVSRRTGASIAEALCEKNYTNVTLLELEPEKFAAQITEQHIDVVFNALHGRYGEDGVIQGLCEMMKIPYTGPGVMASAVGMNKVMSKCAFQGAGISTAPFAYYFQHQESKRSRPIWIRALPFLSSLNLPDKGQVLVPSSSRRKKMSCQLLKKLSDIAFLSLWNSLLTAMNLRWPLWMMSCFRSSKSYRVRENMTIIPNTRLE